MTDAEEPGNDGFDDAMTSSQGDPRVLLVMNAVLSTLFAVSIVWGLSFVGLLDFSPLNVATAVILLFTVTYAVTMT